MRILTPGGLVRGSGIRPAGSFRLNLASPQAHGLVSWIPLTDFMTSGKTITDHSLYGRDLGITGSLTGVNDEVLLHGVQSDSTAEFIATPSPANVGITNGYTWHLVVNGANAPQSSNGFAQWYANGSAHFGFNWHHNTASNEADMFHFNSGGGYERTGKLNTTLTANTWWWITGVWNGADLRCYVNGLLDKTSGAVTSLISLANTTGELWHVAGVNHTMRTAEFRLYNRAFAPEEVWQLYDPATRWDLYLPVRSILPVSVLVTGAYTLDAAAGTYALSGAAAGLRAARRITASAGAYTLSGSAAVLRRGVRLAADAGSYAVTGSAALLRAARTVVALAGSYTLTGTAAGLRRAVMLAAESGVYTLTGATALLRAARRLVAAAGSYVLTGTAATLVASGAGGHTGTFTALRQIGVPMRVRTFLPKEAADAGGGGLVRFRPFWRPRRR